MKKCIFLITFAFLNFYPRSSTADCSQFFHGIVWPIPNHVMQKNLVALCQTDAGSPTEYYATLFSTTDKIPVYSANVVNINNQKKCSRPGNYLWRRVARVLCNHQSLPPNLYYSQIGSQGTMNCGQLQALDSDYKYNNLQLDRGHLTPNSINARNYYKQRATFTLTNAAPQYRQFNGQWWRVIECITEQTILDWVPNENVYIMTGTYGIGSPSHLKSVLVPGYYWKAVCYPGNVHTGASPWGYAIIRQNVNVRQRVSFNDYVTLNYFTNVYFPNSPPFGINCINAPFGRFQFLSNPVVWDQYLKRCRAPKN